MKWDTNNIIAIGLVLMGCVAVTGWVLLSYKSGSSVGTEIPIGIISGLTGVLTGKKLAEYENQSKPSEVLGQVSQAAGQAQNIVNAIDALSHIGKKETKE
jgi:hypothetical protein